MIQERAMTPMRLLAATVLLLFLSVAEFATTVQSFQYDMDTRDDCSEQVSGCKSDPDIFFECPYSCTQELYLTGLLGSDQDREFFNQPPMQLASGRTIEFEDLDGYVTVFAIVPLYPGMAHYYYEMLEHVQSVFPYTVETLIQPLRLDNDEHKDVTLVPPTADKTKPSKVMILPEANANANENKRYPSQLEYLLSIEPQMGSDDKTFYNDRVTIFIISMDGLYIERSISPPMGELEGRLKVYLEQMEGPAKILAHHREF